MMAEAAARETSTRGIDVPNRDPVPEFDLYEALGVPLDADAQAIDRAWRNRVRATHPDRASSAGDRQATEQTARLNIARDWLTDESRRRRYDELRRPLPGTQIPDLDPLASWPARPPVPSNPGSVMQIALALASLLVLVVMVRVGIGTSYFTVAAFGISLVLMVYFGLLLLFGWAGRVRD